MEGVRVVERKLRKANKEAVAEEINILLLLYVSAPPHTNKVVERQAQEERRS